jgi:hypothetical protein
MKKLSCLTPDELADHEKRPGATGNKAAFLRAACGTRTEEEAARFLALIDHCCEQISHPGGLQPNSP